MENKKNGTRFVINFIDKTITGTKASFDKAGKGEGEIYIELADKMAAYPEYKLVIKEQKKRSTKTKQTYDGLNFDLMEKFIEIQPNTKTLMKEYNEAKSMADQIGTSKYPFVKKWFLGQFKEFDVADAKEAISNHNISLVVQNAAATPSGDTNLAMAV